LVDAARDRIGRAIFKTWDAHDIDELVRLMRKFADAVKGDPLVGFVNQGFCAGAFSARDRYRKIGASE